MDKRLTVILADVFGLREKEILPDLSREDVDSWDSLKQMDLVLSLERNYEIALDISDIVKMMAVSDIIAVLNGKGVNLES
jgi:acyl carrier protein